MKLTENCRPSHLHFLDSIGSVRSTSRRSNDKPSGRKTMLTEPSPRVLRTEIIAEEDEISDNRDDTPSETISNIPDEALDSYGALEQTRPEESDSNESKDGKLSEQKSVSALSILQGASLAYDAYVEKFKVPKESVWNLKVKKRHRKGSKSQEGFGNMSCLALP